MFRKWRHCSYKTLLVTIEETFLQNKALRSLIFLLFFHFVKNYDVDVDIPPPTSNKMQYLNFTCLRPKITRDYFYLNSLRRLHNDSYKYWSFNNPVSYHLNKAPCHNRTPSLIGIRSHTIILSTLYQDQIILKETFFDWLFPIRYCNGKTW